MFAHIGCPPQILKVVKQVKSEKVKKGDIYFVQQTGLSEGHIHKKYIEFKQKFPSGFVRKYQLTHLLVDRSFLTVCGTIFHHSCNFSDTSPL